MPSMDYVLVTSVMTEDGFYGRHAFGDVAAKFWLSGAWCDSPYDRVKMCTSIQNHGVNKAWQNLSSM